VSDNLSTPNQLKIPKHIAIVMDGNGRWAVQRNKPRALGHKAGVDALRKTIEACVRLRVDALTVFAFSSENWLRPEKEVDLLMRLFLATLKRQAASLQKNNIRLKVIGDCSRFSSALQKSIQTVEALTAGSDGLTLIIAANYGGQWDIEQAAIRLSEHMTSLAGQSDGMQLKDFLSTAEVVDPDLFIRTGGEKRISNFLLMQLAYSELYFTDTLWPDFNEQSLLDAINDFSSRQRRFGQTGEQINQQE